MKVLILSYDFYPENKPNTYRWFNIAKNWAERGVEVYVVTADKNQYKALEEVDGIKIYRSTEYFIGNLKYQYRDDVNKSNEFVGEAKKFSTFLKRSFRKIYDLTWSNLYWPDHSFLWTYSAVPLASKIIEEYNIDSIVTVSWTFSAHRIGDKLKQKFPKLYWLADTIDPFSFNAKVNNTFLYGKLNASYENKIFDRADFNSVLTERIKNEYISLFPLIKEKITIINNIFIPVEFDYIKKEHADKKLRLLFLGTLSKGTRSPENLLFLFNKLIEKFSDINLELNFYGNFTDTVVDFQKYPQLLNKYIYLNGFIGKEQVNEVIRDADILINIGNSNEYQEPSKLIEYMYSGKKILNVCSIKNDSSVALLEIYPLAINIYPDDLTNDLVLDKLITFFNIKTKIDKESIRHILKDYLLESVADQYLKILSKQSI